MVREDSQDALESTIELGVRSANVASFVALAQITAVVINGITLVAIARMLIPETYGVYALAYALAALFGALCNIGFGNYLNKHAPHFLARKDDRKISEMFGDAFFFTLVIGIAASLVGVALSAVISVYVFHAADYAGIVDFAMLSVIVTALLNLVYTALIGFGDGRGAVVTYVTNNLLATSSVLLVYLGYGATGAIAGIIIGPLAGTAVGVAIVARRYGLRLDWRGMAGRAKRMFRFSLPIAGGTVVSGLVSSSSVPLLGLFALPAMVAPFGVAIRVGALISIEMGFVGAVLIQLFANALERTRRPGRLKELYNYSIYFGVLITAPIVMYLVDFPAALVSTVFPAYGAAVYYIPAIGAGLLLGIIGSYGVSLAISAGDVRKTLKYALVTSAVQFGSMLVLVPFIGAYGIIIGFFLLGSLVSDYLYIRYARDSMHIRTELGSLLRILLASAIVAVIVFPINLINIRPLFQLAAGVIAVIILYPPMLVKTGAVGRKELALLDRMSKRVQTFGRIIGAVTAYASLFS